MQFSLAPQLQLTNSTCPGQWCKHQCRALLQYTMATTLATKHHINCIHTLLGLRQQHLYI